MKKNIKVLIIMLSVLIIIILALIFYQLYKNNTSINTDYYDDLPYKVEVTNTVEVCKKDDCKREQVNEYVQLSIKNNSIKEMNEVVDKINKDTKELYNKEINSSECTKYKDIYYHSLVYKTYFTVYEDEDYLSIAVSRKEENLCEDKVTVNQTEVYVYDKNNKKILTQEELIKELNLDSKEVINTINKEILRYEEDNKIKNTNNTINDLNDIVFYFGINGEISASFKLESENTYITVNI